MCVHSSSCKAFRLVDSSCGPVAFHVVPWQCAPLDYAITSHHIANRSSVWHYLFFVLSSSIELLDGLLLAPSSRNAH